MTLRADKNSGASTAWIDLTYTNDPLGSVQVHGTEYRPGEFGKVWLQLLNSSGQEINTAICRVDIYDMDGGEYIERATMTNQVHDGIFYYNLYVPEEYGVYPVIAKCFYDAQTNNSLATGSVINIGTATGGTTYVNTWADDNVYHDIDEVNTAGIHRIDVIYNYSSVVQTSVNNTLGWHVDWHGRWANSPAGDNPTIQLFNYTSSSWIVLENTISSVGAGDQFVSNSFNTPITNLTQLGIISSTGKVALRIVDNTTLADGTKTKLKTDYLWFAIDYTTDAGNWAEVRGGSEIHVADSFDYYRESYSNSTWNFENRSLTNYSNFNVTVNTNITDSSIASAVWNYSGTVSSNILTQFATSIWAFASRTLTAFGFFDYSAAADYVWNSTTNNRTLLNEINISTLTANEVWNYTNRTLTGNAQINLTDVANATWEYQACYTHGVILS
jgi:hypothetical protein